MTDSLKLSEMHRTNIEFERQRHLANWFIKSSPHMASPPTQNPQLQQQQQPPTSSSSGPNQGQLSLNPNGCSQNNVSNSNNCNVSGIHHHHVQPLHPHLQDGRKPKLRRFNSHDTSANMFSVAEFENARLARRNEIEMKQRLMQQQRTKMNSLSSGGDCSTGDSKGSKYSNDSQTEPLQADAFLERYSLPRVVRISYKEKCVGHETLQSSSSNGSSTNTTNTSTTQSANTTTNTTTSSSSSCASSNTKSNNNNNNNSNGNNNITNNNNVNITNKNNSTIDITGNSNGTGDNNGTVNTTKQNGELFLLYRHLKQRKIYHGFNTKHGVVNRKKGFKIPQEYPGYFSLVNDKSSPTATVYTTLMQLVRERVYKFISVDGLTAFTESPSPSLQTNSPQSMGNGTSLPQYVKTHARGGQVFRLLAVFEDGKQDNSGCKASTFNSSSGREKDKGRYAQLLNENRQTLYVSLGTKGKFYEIEQSVPLILQKNGCGGGLSAPDSEKKINSDCVHKISALLSQTKEWPIQLRFIAGPQQSASSTNSIPENLTITNCTTEDVVVTCPIENGDTQSLLHLRKLDMTPEMLFTKCMLGFESEQRMLANQNVQNILKFCQFNCDQFLKTIDVEVLNRPERSGSKSRVDGLKILKPLHLPKILRREKSTAHEKEDSIIFLSKNDLANIETTPPPPTSNRITDKMKVFQSSKKKWFRRSDKNTVTSLDLDVHSKRMSMERYSDMSKLLQERFGDVLNEEPANDTKPKPGMMIQKSKSLQEVTEFVNKPDLVPESESICEKVVEEELSEADDEEKENKNQRQSFISQKLYSEFHVKTRLPHSKSSSSLHQLLHFAVPQKMNIVEKKPIKKLEFNIGEAVTFREKTLSLMNSSTSDVIIDDLPYSSVRDSLLGGNMDESVSGNFSTINVGENIYAEICHDEMNGLLHQQGAAISRIQISGNGDVISVTSPAHDDEYFEFQDAKEDQEEDVSDNDSVFVDTVATTNGAKEDKIGASNDNIYNTLK